MTDHNHTPDQILADASHDAHARKVALLTNATLSFVACAEAIAGRQLTDAELDTFVDRRRAAALEIIWRVAGIEAIERLRQTFLGPDDEPYAQVILGRMERDVAHSPGAPTHAHLAASTFNITSVDPDDPRANSLDSQLRVVVEPPTDLKN